jgi:uncharacterized protein (DUF1499 family)
MSLGTRGAAAAALALLLVACSADTSDVDLRRMTRSGATNEFLACPPDYCAAAADATTPIYRVPAPRLIAIVRGVLAEQPRMTILREGALAAPRDGSAQAGGGRIVAVQRSLVFRFPDTIWIEIAPQGEQARLAIYSRSAYGRSDFGVNRARVETLLAAIGAAAAR